MALKKSALHDDEAFAGDRGYDRNEPKAAGPQPDLLTNTILSTSKRSS